MIDLKAIRAAAEFTKNNTSSSFSVIETDVLIVLLDRLEAAEKTPAEVLERAAEAVCDAIAFNGGTVQMEAHVRAAIEGLK